MKIIMRTCDIVQLGKKRVWEYLKNKGMDMDKPIYGYPCKAANTAYGFAYDGKTKTEQKE